MSIVHIINLKINTSRLQIVSKNEHLNFEYCYLNMKINLSILKIVI